MSDVISFTYKDFKTSLTKVTTNADDVLIFKFSPTSGQEDIKTSMDIIQEVFPDNQVIALCGDDDLLIANPTEAIDMLEKMIAKIKLLHDTPKSGIILSE